MAPSHNRPTASLHSRQPSAPGDAGVEAPAYETCAILVDFDNFYPGQIASSEELQQEIGHMVERALTTGTQVRRIAIRLYGGWLEDGILTNRASEIQLAVGQPSFSFPHPDKRDLVVHVTVTLVTRLASVPRLEWRHTLRTRLGIPQMRLVDSPRPAGCQDAASCPIYTLRQISRRSSRVCQVHECNVSNKLAFTIREQKMVDSLLACDCIFYSDGDAAVIVMSNDLDVLPGVAMAAASRSHSGNLMLIRSSADAQNLYDEPLADLGVDTVIWVAA
jgi:hypothetical protein